MTTYYPQQTYTSPYPTDAIMQPSPQAYQPQYYQQASTMESQSQQAPQMAPRPAQLDEGGFPLYDPRDFEPAPAPAPPARIVEPAYDPVPVPDRPLGAHERQVPPLPTRSPLRQQQQSALPDHLEGYAGQPSFYGADRDLAPTPNAMYSSEDHSTQASYPYAEQQYAPPAAAPYHPADYAGQVSFSGASQQYASAATSSYPPEKLGRQSPFAGAQQFAPPPRPHTEEHDISSAIHYTRDPHKLVAYLVPFPKPRLNGIPPEAIPERFLIYTPPPPPLSKPKEGEKEEKMHKLQRKWEEEVREAKTSNAKLASWKGVKGKATKGISWAMSQTKNSNLEFLNRAGGGNPDQKPTPTGDTYQEAEAAKKTVRLDEMVLVYPTSMGTDSDKIREEFVNTMLRSKTKAQRDAVIATGLMPVSFAIDVMVMLIWPFGGLLEIDSVWAYSSFRGAKTSRNVTKRLNSTQNSAPGSSEEDKLHLNFTPSPRLLILQRYLATRCHERDPKLFASAGIAPTETEVLETIGWSPSQTGGETSNWEDEQWEIAEVKEDLKGVMGKGSREWDKWCKLYEKDQEKAMKK